MININDEIRNKARIKAVINKVEEIFENQYFTSIEDLCDAMKLGGVDLLVLKSKICNLFEGEISRDEMEILGMYITNFYWIFKEFKSHLIAGKRIKCNYAMRMKKSIIEYIEELCYKYGGLSVDD